MKPIKWANVAFNLVMAVLIGLAGKSFGMDSGSASIVGGSVFAAGFLVKSTQVPSFMMAIQKEVWDTELVENLYKANPFLNYAFDADRYVYAGKVVHISVAAAPPGVEKNRTSLPANITRRTDTDITFPLDVYTTNAERFEDADLHELAFDKRQEAIQDHAGVMFELIGDWMLRDWFSKTDTGGTKTGHIIRTTGEPGVAAHLPDATGLRKKLVKEDLKKAMTYMNKNKIAKTDRYALIDSEMYDQLMDDADLKKRDGAQGGEANLKEGVIMKLYGFNIMERATVLVFDNATTPVVVNPGTAGDAAHNAAVLCWQKNAVIKALGQTRVFENEGVAEYYGDVMSALQRAGGRIRREKGVVAIVQDVYVAP